MKREPIQTASHWGVYQVTTDDDERIVRTSPLRRDPHPAAFYDGLPEIVRSGLRIDRPYVRAGFLRHREKSRDGRGSDRFVAVSWDEALNLVEQELRRVTATFGNEAIYGGSYGWASAGRLHHSPSVLKRFLGMIAGREPLRMNPADAESRGLRAGDFVRVFNDRGAFVAAVQIVDDLMAGVVQIATGAWFDPVEPGTPGSLEKHGNPNVVTDDKGTSRLGQSSVAQTALIEVERIHALPDLTAYDLPQFARKDDELWALAESA